MVASSGIPVRAVAPAGHVPTTVARRASHIYGAGPHTVFVCLRFVAVRRVAYEDRAAVITDWEQRGIPGLLQTKDYARAVIRACRPYDPPEALEHEVRSRLERQDILTRDDPPNLWVIISEGVLRQRVGSRDVMAAQLDHLIKVAESPRAVIQVLPFTAADAPGADGPATSSSSVRRSRWPTSKAGAPGAWSRTLKTLRPSRRRLA